LYQKTTLANGLRIVSESIPYVHSASVGIWVKAGSRYETPEEHGVSHFVEHMLFKGTSNRTAKEISMDFEAVGGYLNAFTSKEHICLYSRVLDEDLDLALEILTDIFFNSLFSPPDFERERRVILEEIKMYEDAPDEIVHDRLAANLWGKHPLGRAVLGTEQSLKNLELKRLKAYFSRRYRPENLVIAAAGNLDHRRLVEQIESHWERLSPGRENETLLQPPKPCPEVTLEDKDTEQVQICLGASGVAQDDPDLPAVQVLNTILGGGVSSRLFQEIREDRGLAYSVFSYHSAYLDTGLFGIYAGTSRASSGEVLDLILQETEKIRREGIMAAELERAKAQIKGSTYLSLESVSNRMSRLGRSEISFDRVIAPEEFIAKIESVSLEQVRQVAGRLLEPGQFAVSLIGDEVSDLGLPGILAQKDV